MFEPDKYLSLPYEIGVNDCFSLIRRILKERWDIELPNYARPTEFWSDPNLDLYGGYASHGFEQVFDKPFEVGDILLMPLGTAVNSHAALVLEGNQIIHHLPNTLSSLDPLLPKWGRRANIVLRHPKVKKAMQKEVTYIQDVIDAHVLKNPRVKEVLERAMETEEGTVRGDPSGSDDPGNP